MLCAHTKGDKNTKPFRGNDVASAVSERICPHAVPIETRL